MRAGLVVVAACLFAFGPASSALALAPSSHAPDRPEATSAARGSDGVASDRGNPEHAPRRSEPTDTKESSEGTEYSWMIEAGAAGPVEVGDEADETVPRPTDPENSRSGRSDTAGHGDSGDERHDEHLEIDDSGGEGPDDHPGQGTAGGGHGGQSTDSPTTTTSILDTTRAQTDDPDSSDDSDSTDEVTSKVSGSGTKSTSSSDDGAAVPPAASVSDTTTTTVPVAEATVVSGDVTYSPERSTTPSPAIAVDDGAEGSSPSKAPPPASTAKWSFLSGEDPSPDVPLAPVGLPATIDERSGATSVVLSWLVEREALGSSMSVLTPVVVLLTIWDAITSAGSGVAAPASGLGTFVLLVLFDKTRLGAGNGLLRRGSAGVGPEVSPSEPREA